MTLSTSTSARHSTPLSPQGGVWLIGLVAVAGFGPYVAGPLRTDQIVVYGGLLLFPLLAGRHRPAGWQIGTISMWAVFVLLAVISWATVPAYQREGAIAMADNLLLPLAVAVLTVIAVGPEHRDKALRVVSWVAVTGMSINAVVAFAQIVQGETSLNLGRWSVATEETTAERAAQLGRFSGLISQPALAGTMYAVAILCAIFVMRHRPATLTLVMGLLVAGGAVTVSKFFIFAALPIVAIVYLVTVGRRHPYIALVAAACVGFVMWFREDLIVYAYETFPTWDGVARLDQILNSSLTVSQLTGNRFGDEGVVGDHLATVMAQSPALGFGLGGGDFPIDSTLIFALALGGVVGVAILVVVHGILWAWLVSAWSGLPHSERWFALGLIAAVTASAVGYPILIGDRLAVLLWPLLMLLMAPRPDITDAVAVTR
ncbi:hypothetical protein NGF75_08240 [Dietzia kunjamensis]|uniref:hypothetical protein n=1 Tax=Dietzia kunjamensis TaxID=322509 RepID=UPI002DBD8E0D|nr:hypothetical protein [Dietzia kunjamensis]MEB8325976.1 hypothetical protein [Dietzia kunjamensis]